MISRGQMGKQIGLAPSSRGMRSMAKPMPMVRPTANPMTMVRPMATAKPVLGMAKGGKVSRGDGCCMKGKTKGKHC